MIPYIVFVILVLVFRHNNKPKLIYLTLLLFSVLRYDTGWDYMSYYTKVEMWGDESISWERFSFIWKWLFQAANNLNEPHLVIAVPAFLTITIIYGVVKQIQKDPPRICDTMTIYALWPFFYLSTFSTIRQALAIAIGLLIMCCAIKKKIVLFFLLLILNFYVHPSSVICVLFAVFFFPNFRLKVRHFMIIVIVAGLAIHSLESILSGSVLGQYLFYLDDTDSFGSKLSILLAMILIPCILVKSKSLTFVGGGQFVDIEIVALVLTIFVYAFSSNSVVARGINYFSILLIFVAPCFPALFKNKRVGSFWVYMSFISVFVYYLISTSDALSLGMATSPFVPYKTLLSR